MHEELFARSARSRLSRRTGDITEARQDRETFARIHANLVTGESLATGADYEFACIDQPMGEVGGDFVEVLCDGPLLDLVLGDVAGKGLDACLIAQALRRELLRARGGRPAQVMAAVNARVADALQRVGRFATASFLRLDPFDLRLTWVDCGHAGLFLRRARTGEVAELGRTRRAPTGNLPLGVDPEARYHEAEETLEPGDTILLVSDGVLEAGARRGAPFGAAGLTSLFHELPEATCAELVEAVRTRCFWRDQGRPADDLTCVALRVAREAEQR